jgi:integrase
MPRAPKFTDRNIIAEAKPGKRLFVRDCPNLYLYTSAGKKRRQRWILRFSRRRLDGSGMTERSLGPYPEVTLEMAKNRANHARTILKRDKINPFTVDWNDGATTTFGEVARKWLDSRDWKNREKQFKDAKHLLLVLPGKEFLEKPIIKIKPSDVRDALIGRSKDKPKQVRRSIAKIEILFDYAKVSHWFFGENPARWKEKQKILFPGLSIERNNFAAMPHEDVPEFMRTLRQHQNSSVAAVALEVLILTATRSGEVRGMKWSELFLDNQVWVIPKERLKRGKREHIVPLSPRVVELLNRRKEQAGRDQYVFSAHRRDTPLDEKSMRQILRKTKTTSAPVTVHGFRSSFRDWAGDETDYPRESIEECLSHQVGNAVERAYRRRTGLEKRTEIMTAWADFCG